MVPGFLSLKDRSGSVRIGVPQQEATSNGGKQPGDVSGFHTGENRKVPAREKAFGTPTRHSQCTTANPGSGQPIRTNPYQRTTRPYSRGQLIEQCFVAADPAAPCATIRSTVDHTSAWEARCGPRYPGQPRTREPTHGWDQSVPSTPPKNGTRAAVAQRQGSNIRLRQTLAPMDSVRPALAPGGTIQRASRDAPRSDARSSHATDQTILAGRDTGNRPAPRSQSAVSVAPISGTGVSGLCATRVNWKRAGQRELHADARNGGDSLGHVLLRTMPSVLRSSSLEWDVSRGSTPPMSTLVVTYLRARRPRRLLG